MIDGYLGSEGKVNQTRFKKFKELIKHAFLVNSISFEKENMIELAGRNRSRKIWKIYRSISKIEKVAY